jgi:hypothetical protein
VRLSSAMKVLPTASGATCSICRQTQQQTRRAGNACQLKRPALPDSLWHFYCMTKSAYEQQHRFGNIRLQCTLCYCCVTVCVIFLPWAT